MTNLAIQANPLSKTATVKHLNITLIKLKTINKIEKRTKN